MCLSRFRFSEKYLLLDDTSSAKDKELGLSMVQREMARQWFGNLVTCSWWDYLWLHDAFAAYFQYFSTDTVRLPLTDWLEYTSSTSGEYGNRSNYNNLLSLNQVFEPWIKDSGIGIAVYRYSKWNRVLSKWKTRNHNIFLKYLVLIQQFELGIGFILKMLYWCDSFTIGIAVIL